ncbi:unnamed protein product [Rotaria magnacalcarata]|uniref:Uncharacterized protein n=2 Tax=Rotaria magnacalcarata TaxID=392030 RepID=A0A816CWP9_9BILA|nr:unnamed protein product [Rotaria magnacalcarata]CAF1670325.1 unnamed protein product [Rotaria magnacalcarata]CAF2173003.1 unnamed protein product [Rotaria magnacalcarata]
MFLIQVTKIIYLTCEQDKVIRVRVFHTKTDHVEHICCADQFYCLTVHVSYFFIFMKNNSLIIKRLSYIRRNKS